MKSKLLDLGEAVGTQSRSLPQELIDTLPTSKYKFGNLFKRKNLPCSYVYHGECITNGLALTRNVLFATLMFSGIILTNLLQNLMTRIHVPETSYDSYQARWAA
ncbi:E3 ubiquitin-protein ligase BIG BROTHER-like isoform X2 [Trifolium pratense]|uniref:E3 ubiquitin-protein ligase BIG BROTHER-like isoform X2 n=1 Tax=Trifolium pratense TaxID=57577 RepID=UPI001E690BCA|nr:E3 ubiquitin-protein ligase BIG BROTHER-like isoform X2 [Trifolium pratense]